MTHRSTLSKFSYPSMLKQRVPIAKLGEAGNCYVTIEWLKDLNALVSSDSAGGVTQEQFNTLQAQVNTQQALIELLVEANQQAQIAINQLRNGFQS